MASLVAARSAARRAVASHGRRTLSSSPIVELREYNLKIEGAGAYMAATADAAELRKRLVPMRLFSLPETGGRLAVATHFYAYDGHVERDAIRAEQAKDPDWGAYLGAARPHVAEQKSSIFVEAAGLHEAHGLQGMASAESPGGASAAAGIYELRRYRLKLGYDTVPNFLERLGGGLESKLATLAEGSALCSVMYNDVGDLNEVVEVWRHASSNGMLASREAARAAASWREAIASIAPLANSFSTTIHRPAAFSAWK